MNYRTARAVVVGIGVLVLLVVALCGLAASAVTG